MRGLKDYVKKHGKHFTEELAYIAAGRKKWSLKEIEEATQKKVYYNITDTSFADMTYIANSVHVDTGWGKNKCIKFTLAIVQDYKIGKDLALRNFVHRDVAHTFDLTPFI